MRELLHENTGHQDVNNEWYNHSCFGRTPAEDKETTTSEQQGIISIEVVEEKTGNDRFSVEYIKAYDGLSL